MGIVRLERRYSKVVMHNSREVIGGMWQLRVIVVVDSDLKRGGGQGHRPEGNKGYQEPHRQGGGVDQRLVGGKDKHEDPQLQ
jgi:hypothetical protein